MSVDGDQEGREELRLVAKERERERVGGRGANDRKRMAVSEEVDDLEALTR